MTMMGVAPAPEYAEFSKTTLEYGLRAALDEANARYEGLDPPATG